MYASSQVSSSSRCWVMWRFRRLCLAHLATTPVAHSRFSGHSSNLWLRPCCQTFFLGWLKQWETQERRLRSEHETAACFCNALVKSHNTRLCLIGLCCVTLSYVQLHSFNLYSIARPVEKISHCYINSTVGNTFWSKYIDVLVVNFVYNCDRVRVTGTSKITM